MACEIKDPTNNPICSDSIKDLKDNAIIMDQYINSEEFEVPDRLGIPRKTWAGIEKDAQDNIDGFEYLINDKIIAQGGVEIINDWDQASDENVFSAGFLSRHITKSIYDFGGVADGDGSGGGSDNSTALNIAYESHVGVLVIKNKGTGVYNFKSKIKGNGNLKVIIEDGAKLDFTSINTNLSPNETGGLWECRGNYSGGEIAISENIVGDIVETVTPHGLQVGDFILIKGQRNSLHEDAGDWRLGRATGSVDHHALYFGEPAVISEVINTTKVKLQSPVIFPFYFKDNAAETSAAAKRGSTTIQKMDLAKGFSVAGGEFLHRNNTMFYTKLCFEPTIKATKFRRVGGVGMNILSTYNYKPKMTDLVSHNLQEYYIVEDHSQYNSFKSRSDWYPTWSYEDNYGVQGLDISYELGGVPTIYATVEYAKSYNSFENGITMHSGCYGWSISNLEVYNCQASGALLRSRNGTLNNYTINSKFPVNGLTLSEWFVDSSILNGSIDVGLDGFLLATHALFPDDDPERQVPKYRNVNIDNMRVKAGRNIGSINNQNVKSNTMSGITLSNINVTDFTGSLRVGSYSNGVKVLGMVASSIDINNDQPAISVDNNSVMNTFTNVERISKTNAPAISLLGMSNDKETFPESLYSYRGTGNIAINCSSNRGNPVVFRNLDTVLLSETITNLNSTIEREGYAATQTGLTEVTRTLHLPEDSALVDTGVVVHLINRSPRATVAVSSHSSIVVLGEVQSIQGGSLSLEKVNWNTWISRRA